VKAGWAVSYRFLADQASWVCVTRRGLALVELDNVFHARIPSPKRLDHIWAVNQVRLVLESYKKLTEEGMSGTLNGNLLADEEDAEREARRKKERYARHPIPDGSFETDGLWIAIEVEINAEETGRASREVEAAL